MSMFYHWVHHDQRQVDNAVTIKTVTATRGRHHLPADRYTLKVTSVEAMDDSILFANSWDDLALLVYLSETFQSAYGVKTCWDSADKTVCFTLGKRANEHTVVTFFDSENTPHDVPYTTEPRMLRSAIANPEAAKQDILDIIDRFAIRRGVGPKGSDYPLSIIRRAVNTLLVSKIRSKLSLQPLSAAMAHEIDQAVSRKVTDALGVKATLTDILTLPLKNLGFGFPSIFEINGTCAIDRVLRAMNHHLSPFRDHGLHHDGELAMPRAPLCPTPRVDQTPHASAPRQP